MLVDPVERFMNFASSYMEQFDVMADGRFATDIAQIDMLSPGLPIDEAATEHVELQQRALVSPRLGQVSP